MSNAPSITKLLSAFDRWKVHYVPTTIGGVPWTKRNRNSKGAWGDMVGILDHHTATGAALSGVPNVISLLAKGRSDLPGPLCHFAPSPDGKLYLIGWGRANHAGQLDADVIRAVRNESYGRNPPYPDKDAVDGNAILYGFETIHPGTNADYPNRQMECLVRANAAICELHGWGAKSIIQHGEGTRRKPDMSFMGGPRPAGARVRDEVTRALKEGPARYGYPVSTQGAVTLAAAKKKPKPVPAKARPTVSVKALRAAAGADPKRAQGKGTPGAVDDVKVVESALRRAGLLPAKYAGDGSYGGTTVKAYAWWQRKLGYRGNDANGIPGETSLKKLGARYGFNVKP